MCGNVVLGIMSHCLILLKGMLLVLWQLVLGVKNCRAVVCQEPNDKRLRFVDRLTVFLFPQNSGFAQRDPGM